MEIDTGNDDGCEGGKAISMSKGGRSKGEESHGKNIYLNSLTLKTATWFECTVKTHFISLIFTLSAVAVLNHTSETVFLYHHILHYLHAISLYP